MGKPRKLIVSCRWTSRMTRLLRSHSILCISWTRALLSIFCRSQGCSMENIKKIQKISPMPLRGGDSFTRPILVGVIALVLFPGLLEQGQQGHPGHEAAHVGPPGHALVVLCAHQRQRAAEQLAPEPL